MRRQGNGGALGRRTLWLTAAVLAATWAPQLRADEAGQPPSAQTATGPQSAEALARELAVTRRDLDTLLRFLNRACSAEPPGLPAKWDADAGLADLRKSLQQEHERASGLEQELAAARRDVASQMALAAKASDEASQLKKTADAGSADLRKSLQQERERASGLEQQLSAARRDIASQTALAAKASDDASQLKKTADAGSADLSKSLQQERDRAKRLEEDLATARRDAETQTALATKASDDASQQKKAADAGAADLRKSLQQEHDRAGLLGRDLALARRKFEKQIALAARAADEAGQFRKTAEASSADLRNGLQQERDRATRLEQDLAAARRDVETQTALVAKAAADASQQKKASDDGAADMRRSLQQEQERTSRLEQDLATARYNLETRAAQAAKSGDETNQVKKTDASSADLAKSLQQERDRANRMEQDLATARREVETQTAMAAKASDEANQAKAIADSSSADLRKSLQQERDRASLMERDLATARGDVATQTALAAKAGDDAKLAKITADASSADLLKSLQQERDKAAQLERDLASARSVALMPSNASPPAQAAKPVVPGQTPLADAPRKPEDTPEIARLVAYARLLLGRGDIGSARIVLQRASELGSAEASFALAETYDPLILSKWGTYGTHGDASRAIDLYAQALAGGVKEAKERSEALHH